MMQPTSKLYDTVVQASCLCCVLPTQVKRSRLSSSLEKGRKAAESGDKSPHSKFGLVLALLLAPSLVAAVQAQEVKPPEFVAVRAVSPIATRWGSGRRWK